MLRARSEQRAELAIRFGLALVSRSPEHRKGAMLRRDFLKTTGAALAFSAMPAYAQQFSDMKKRVALIGTAWYGKSDLFRLLQVAPVEVVSLCDADSNLLNECADMVAERQLSKKRPRAYKHYQELL